MRLIVVLGARLGAVLWGRAPILDPCHRRANLVCSQNVFDSRVAAFNRNCQLGAGRVRLWKRLCVRGAPSNSPCASALTWHRSAHALDVCRLLPQDPGSFACVEFAMVWRPPHIYEKLSTSCV